MGPPLRYELVGQVAIVDLDAQDLGARARAVEAVRSRHSSVRAVLRRVARPSGSRRVGAYEFLWGDSAETLYAENGATFLLDVTRAFASHRMAAERARVAARLRGAGQILCSFAGVGLFPVVIAKAGAGDVTAVESSSAAFRYLRENIARNRVSDRVHPIRKRFETFAPGFKGPPFDAAVLTPPKESPGGKLVHLERALRLLRPAGLLCYYTFGSEEEMAGWRDRGWGVRKCGSYAPGIWRACVEARNR